MFIQTDFIIPGKHQKPIVIDVKHPANKTNLPVIIFCHGYKGFKDWGAWNAMAEAFANAGFCFIKFNFSHNGGTVTQPIDFPDLEAFGNNNYTKELDDLESLIDWLFNSDALKKFVNLSNLTLIGHSRGGGIAAIKAAEDTRISKLISLASVSNFGNRMGTIEDIETWKETGVKFVENGRTKQQMPHYFQFYENFIANQERLTIKRAVSTLKTPHLVIHGTQDSSVLMDEAKNLHYWNPKSTLQIIDGANHVFSAKHPWEENELPAHLKEVVEHVVAFLR